MHIEAPVVAIVAKAVAAPTAAATANATSNLEANGLLLGRWNMLQEIINEIQWLRTQTAL